VEKRLFLVEVSEILKIYKKNISKNFGGSQWIFGGRTVFSENFISFKLFTKPSINLKRNQKNPLNRLCGDYSKFKNLKCKI
jgi:hypothetical protein